jgi:hypothetical protein
MFVTIYSCTSKGHGAHILGTPFQPYAAREQKNLR